ncbi:HIT domain-containing protein [Permianibacter aggregans]|uniref:Diadenosine tetraphosphate (Ap4A) HIT family hydrolase n=1 Tax=Permianibacter aggregans TaxID=1510150 RepID=A0A4R6UD59_9GAMM|nr:HIT domain-containing protein [Permianibacter aggregans]QGX39042.1 HIT domain-containing protein [Permianibacter aggregans]TDQ44618.1 diadenosine tetraphosphate (Ap4A) HIT family hydrolase [Permianibacter aggregans]
MSEPFSLHPQLAADTLVLGDWPLCRLLWMNDQHYPWLILVPRRANIRESFQLEFGDQQQLWLESLAAGKALMQHFAGDKLNVAALGNMVPQLHWHHIVRFKTDPAWPAPVWGKFPPKPYTSEQQLGLMPKLRVCFAQAFPLS